MWVQGGISVGNSECVCVCALYVCEEGLGPNVFANTFQYLLFTLEQFRQCPGRSIKSLNTLHCSMWEACVFKPIQCVYKYILTQVFGMNTCLSRSSAAFLKASHTLVPKFAAVATYWWHSCKCVCACFSCLCGRQEMMFVNLLKLFGIFRGACRAVHFILQSPDWILNLLIPKTDSLILRFFFLHPECTWLNISSVFFS